ncbi:acyl-[acyl-carrier-protein] thioesterase [Anaerococcus sp. Marseille-P3915]|uniref:acyl-[acyl-carrier-protein] thioesterase n=1 Tax=Anaerococcus sp. Marseille-P3915 TaxID=2057799 RepID=UPI000D0BA78C|nr:acyl-ACP thioesterase domain-containing protein [Anaerococcus sp. Marseille-P3915]
MKETMTYRIGSMLCNKEAFLSFKNLTGLMFDVSFIQSAKVEKDLDMKGKAWLVYSWDIEIDEHIKAGDVIEITSIPTKIKRFYAYRNFLVKKDGKEIARACAKLILFDRLKGKLIPIDENIQKAYGEEKLIYAGKDFKRSSDFDNSKQIIIRKADFDENSHVNNGIYFDFLKEIENIREDRISYIKIIYKNEIKDQKEISLSYRNTENEVEFSIDSDNTNHSYGVIRYV